MSLRIADLPVDERPRERLSRHGPATLADSELLALVLGTGTRGRNALEVARAVLADGLTTAARREWRAHVRVTGIGDAHAAKIAAAFELGRRATRRDLPLEEPVRGPETLAKALMAMHGHHVQERLGAIYLDAKHRIIRERELYIGTLNSAVVGTRDILSGALQEHAASVIVFHNHPSGDPSPSAEDLAFTRKLVEAGKLLGIDVVDHLIIGMGRYVSLKERGMM
jgi:DNA repair protein RadC